MGVTEAIHFKPAFRAAFYGLVILVSTLSFDQFCFGVLRTFFIEYCIRLVKK